MAELTPVPGTPRQRFVSGVKVVTGMALAAFLLAVTFGALARSQGWGVLAPIVCSVIVFSGSAQFALATALAGGAGIPTAVVAVALINGRFIPMGVAVAGDLHSGRVRKALEGQAVVDGSWAAAGSTATSCSARPSCSGRPG